MYLQYNLDLNHENSNYQAYDFIHALDKFHINETVSVSRNYVETNKYYVSFPNENIYMESTDKYSGNADYHMVGLSARYDADNQTFKIRLELSSEPDDNYAVESENEFVKYKHQLEDYLSELFLLLDPNELYHEKSGYPLYPDIDSLFTYKLPLFHNGEYHPQDAYWLLFYMVLKIKQTCKFEIVSDLDMTKWWMTQKMYPSLSMQRQEEQISLYDEWDRLKPKDIEEPIPPVLTNEIMMSLLGLFSWYRGDEQSCRIKICPRNIEKTSWMMTQKDDFIKKYFLPIKVVTNRNQEDTTYLIQAWLRVITTIHELGHMIFRDLSLKNVKDKESLANWVVALFANDYMYHLTYGLTKIQPKEYHSFIKMPVISNLNIEKYKKYCDQIWKLIEG